MLILLVAVILSLSLFASRYSDNRMSTNLEYSGISLNMKNSWNS